MAGQGGRQGRIVGKSQIAAEPDHGSLHGASLGQCRSGQIIPGDPCFATDRPAGATLRRYTAQADHPMELKMSILPAAATLRIFPRFLLAAAVLYALSGPVQWLWRKRSG